MNTYKDLIVIVNDVEYNFNDCNAATLLTCSRTAGFELWDGYQTLIGSEFTSEKFKIVFNGKILIDKKPKQTITLDELLLTPEWPINLDLYKDKETIIFNTLLSVTGSRTTVLRDFSSFKKLKAKFVFSSVEYNKDTKEIFNPIMLEEGKDYHVIRLTNEGDMVRVVFYKTSLIQLDISKSDIYDLHN